MSKKLSEEDVKAKLGITDFRHLKKENIMEFMSCVPEMDKEVAMKCIEQFPEFKSFANETVNGFYNLCAEVIKDDKEDAVDACMKTLDDLRFILQKDDISESMKMFIIEKIVEVDQLLAELTKEKHVFKETVLKVAGGLGAVGLTVAGALLGLKLKKK